MPDREKTIADLQKVVDAERGTLEIDGLILNPFVIIPLMKDALALLKEQDSVDHALDILKAHGWTQTEPICSECDAVHVVQCKDCKHRGEWKRGDFSYVEFPDGSKCPCQCDDFFYSWRPDDDWFCANGERT